MAHGADSASTPRRATIPRTGGQRPKDMQADATFLTPSVSSRLWSLAYVYLFGEILVCVFVASYVFPYSLVWWASLLFFVLPGSCLRASACLATTTISSILRHPSFWAKELRSGDRMRRSKLRFRLVPLTGDNAHGDNVSTTSLRYSSNSTVPIDNMRVSDDDTKPGDRIFREDNQSKKHILVFRVRVETAFPFHGQRQQRLMSHIQFMRWYRGLNFYTLSRNFSSS